MHIFTSKNDKEVHWNIERAKLGMWFPKLHATLTNMLDFTSKNCVYPRKNIYKCLSSSTCRCPRDPCFITVMGFSSTSSPGNGWNQVDMLQVATDSEVYTHPEMIKISEWHSVWYNNRPETRKFQSPPISILDMNVANPMPETIPFTKHLASFYIIPVLAVYLIKDPYWRWFFIGFTTRLHFPLLKSPFSSMNFPARNPA